MRLEVKRPFVLWQFFELAAQQVATPRFFPKLFPPPSVYTTARDGRGAGRRIFEKPQITAVRAARNVEPGQLNDQPRPLAVVVFVVLEPRGEAYPTAGVLRRQLAGVERARGVLK